MIWEKDDRINHKVSSNQYYQAKINDIKNDKNDLNIFTFELESGSTLNRKRRGFFIINKIEYYLD